jgi:DNA-binding winged helix-turn-helix (wHTH) protein/Tol biopolymer transport system component
VTGNVQFGVFELDRNALELRKHGVPIRLGEQPLQLLAALLEQPGQIVTRDELQERLWGRETFVDFEHSLNKAVNRLREALNDEPSNPVFIQTIPRRGYRFIAPVATTLAPTEPSAAIHKNLPPQVETTVAEVSKTGVPAGINVVALDPARSGSRARTTIISVSGAAVLVFAAVGALLWNQRRPHTLPDTKFITSAANCCARLTRDGKLLAYVSPDGAGPPHIWVQQTAGGEAIQVTRGPDGVIGPDFSPDGTHLVFLCKQGICTAPTLSGAPQLVLKATQVRFPVYSPDGLTILYLDAAENRAMTVSVKGGEPMALDLDREFLVHGAPIWSPDGDQILFYGVRKREPGRPDGWWIAPLSAGGGPRPLLLPDMEKVVDDKEIAARAWLRKKNGSEWIVYTAQGAEVWKMFRIQVSSQGEIRGTPEEITFGAGEIGYSVSVADDGKVAYPTFASRQTTFSIPIDSRGQKAGPASELRLAPGTDSYSPSISRDGRWLAYVEDTPGKSNNIVLTDLRSGRNRILDEASRRSNYSVGIAPDGSKVSFEQDCGNRRWQSGEPVNCGFVGAIEGERPRKVCESCIPRGFSSDDSVLLVRKFNPIHDDKPPGWIAALHLASGTEKQLVASPGSAIESASLSWDDRWIIFAREVGAKGQIMIAPIRDGIAGKEPEWVAVTDGAHNDGGPQFSPDGNTAYFISRRDGYDCIWAQRLEPATKRPAGEAFGYEHFHDASQKDLDGFWNGDSADLSVARDKIIVSLVQWHVGIWMTQIE